MVTGRTMGGLFAINKPRGMSSAQVIRDCQNYFNTSELFKPLMEQEIQNRLVEPRAQSQRRSRLKRQLKIKMGHGGTLDPLATGLLILGVGGGTKALSGFLSCTKTYEAVILFGANTDTYDRVGRVVKKRPYDHITQAKVEEALDCFRGAFKQIPPIYSALKMAGKPLYEYAREGKPIPRQIATRDVECIDLELLEWYDPGTHNHRWPVDEASPSELVVVDQVWRVAKRQTEAAASDEPPFTPEQEAEETEARHAFNLSKRRAEARVDSLVIDRESKKAKVDGPDRPGLMMSGALSNPPPGRGSNLVPPPPSPDTPPPWEGKGPPACKIRMTVCAGFYVRSLAHDLGEKLGCGALMAELCRLRQGEFSLVNALDYNDLLKGEDVWSPRIANLMNLKTPRATYRVNKYDPRHNSLAMPPGVVSRGKEDEGEREEEIEGEEVPKKKAKEDAAANAPNRKEDQGAEQDFTNGPDQQDQETHGKRP